MISKFRVPKYRFELLIPLNHNDGTPIDPQILIDIKDELLERFRGGRIQPLSPYLGWYVEAERVYTDLALLFTVEGDRTEENIRWFQDYKRNTLFPLLEDQVEIYLAVSEITWI